MYLFHQPVGAVSLKIIVRSIKGNIMGVSPSIADTFIKHRHMLLKSAFKWSGEFIKKHIQKDEIKYAKMQLIN